ncbi:MAG: RNA polymerase Rbp10 [Thaumarchaeota archaeon]|nr:RNA polymerase Rbp10 [Nitrososphaerota archaeon]
MQALEGKKEDATESAEEEDGPTVSEIFPDVGYECVRCRTKVSKSALDILPSPRCANCGFTVFQKLRPSTVKIVAAA